MYGKKKYQPKSNSKIVNPLPIDPTIPTYICGRCNSLHSTNYEFSEFSLIENKILINYCKMCGPCTELLKNWIKA